MSTINFISQNFNLFYPEENYKFPMNEYLYKYMQPIIDDILFIGDDYNDIEMIDFATTGIAMGHAPEEVKNHANYITKDIDNDGFY